MSIIQELKHAGYTVEEYEPARALTADEIAMANARGVYFEGQDDLPEDAETSGFPQLAAALHVTNNETVNVIVRVDDDATLGSLLSDNHEPNMEPPTSPFETDEV